MAKVKCDHPKHAIRYDPRTGARWCANCGETITGKPSQQLQPKGK